MNYLTLIDGTSAAIVFGGTALGTVLRCGLWNTASALRGLAGALRPRFDAASARAQLALQVQAIHRDGLLRAEPHHFGDPEFDEVADTIIERRSIGALLEKHTAHQDMRTQRSRVAVATFNQAAELAPVFGLAGTLIALSQLPAGEPGTLLSNSIPMAIVTTFYGLMAGHLLFAPIARFIERRAGKEEYQRQQLVDWLASEVTRETERQPVHREPRAA